MFNYNYNTVSNLYTCTDFPEVTSKKNPKKSNIEIIAIGTSLGAAALIVIVILGFCHFQRSRRNSDGAVENADIELRQPVAIGNADAEEDEVIEDTQHLPAGEESPFDLGIIKETDQLSY